MKQIQKKCKRERENERENRWKERNCMIERKQEET